MSQSEQSFLLAKNRTYQRQIEKKNQKVANQESTPFYAMLLQHGRLVSWNQSFQASPEITFASCNLKVSVNDSGKFVSTRNHRRKDQDS